jgi:hypothetical protein
LRIFSTILFGATVLTEKLHNRILMPLLGANERGAFLVVSKVYFC